MRKIVRRVVLLRYVHRSAFGELANVTNNRDPESTKKAGTEVPAESTKVQMVLLKTIGKNPSGIVYTPLATNR